MRWNVKKQDGIEWWDPLDDDEEATDELVEWSDTKLLKEEPYIYWMRKGV